MATVGPSRNSIVAMAWEGLRKDERRMKRIATMTKPSAEKADVHKNPPKADGVAADVHKKAGKLHTSKPVAKKVAAKKKKGGRK